MKRGRLNRISQDRDRKREQSGARGPVCEYARRFACAICGTAKNIDGAHEERVSRGHGDWIWERERWRCRVAPLCRYRCHPRYDDNIVGPAQPLTRHEQARVQVAMRGLGEQWAEDVGVHLSNPVHPYEQWRELGSPEPGDIVTE